MRVGEKIGKAAMIAVAIVGLVMCVMVMKDPNWHVGKAYEDTTEDTRSQDELLASINEKIFEKGGESEPQTEEETTCEPYRDEAVKKVSKKERLIISGAMEKESTTTEIPTAAPTEAATQMQGGNNVILHYSIDGKMMDATLQDILYTTLRECGMEWFMPYAVAQARAESGADFSPYAVSKDGKDKGLFQYREKYWAAKAARIGEQNADIFNPVIQIYVYVFEMHARYASGMKDPAQLISAHKTAGYGYDAAYVAYVLQFVERLKIEKGR